MGSHSAPIPQEYFLQGSVLDNSVDGGHPVDVLLHRLRGLCDQLEPLHGTIDAHMPPVQAHHREGHSVQPFHEHEQVLVMKQTMHGPPTTLRVRRSLDPAHAHTPHHLRYLGTTESEKTKSVSTRQYIDVCTSDTVIPVLEYMGFRLDHEFVVKGNLFRKGRMKIVVSKIYKMLTQGKVDQIEALTGSHVVEVSVVGQPGAGAQGATDPIGDDMKAFAEMLKPLVVLEKVDVRALGR